MDEEMMMEKNMEYLDDVTYRLPLSNCCDALIVAGFCRKCKEDAEY